MSPKEEAALRAIRHVIPTFGGMQANLLVQALEAEGWRHQGRHDETVPMTATEALARAENNPIRQLDHLEARVGSRVRALELQVETLNKAVRALMFPGTPL